MSPHPMIPVPKAIKRVLIETAKVIQNREREETEVISLLSSEDATGEKLLGRICSKRVLASEVGYPTYNAAIMDGYAIDLDEFLVFSQHSEECEEYQFHVKDRIYAGPSRKVKDFIDFDMQDYAKTLPKAIYVTTGAAIPTSYNVVVPIEDVDETDLHDDDIITIPRSVLSKLKKMLWIRPIGCDIKPKSIILEKGAVIEPANLGVLMQCGIIEVEVNRLPKVGILSTGNELFSHQIISEQREFGTIPDVNGPVLCNLYKSYGNCNPRYLGIAKDDDEEKFAEILKQSMIHDDVTITTGGISMGEMDVIERVLINKLGCKIHFGRLNMKPGKPTTFLTAQVEGTSETHLFFAMPGNPCSSIVCSELLIQPCLDMLHENSKCSKLDVDRLVRNATVHGECFASLRHSIKLDTSRPEYHRVKLQLQAPTVMKGNTALNNDFKLYATSSGVQRSSRLLSMCDVDGLMVLPQGIKGGKDQVEAGEVFPVLFTRQMKYKSPLYFLHRKKVYESLHMNASPPLIGILEITGSRTIVSELTSLQQRVLECMGINEINLVSCTSANVNAFLADEGCSCLKDIQKSDVDIILIVALDLTFLEQIALNTRLKSLTSHSSGKGLSNFIRSSSTVDVSTCALFEPVIGWCQNDHKSLLCSLSSDGIEGSLKVFQPLLKEIINKI